MSAQKIRAALGQLQDDPDKEDSWNELFEAVTSPDGGMPQADLRTLLESARRGHETRREWDAVGKLLELEAGLHAGTPVEFAMQLSWLACSKTSCSTTSAPRRPTSASSRSVLPIPRPKRPSNAARASARNGRSSSSATWKRPSKRPTPPSRARSS